MKAQTRHWIWIAIVVYACLAFLHHLQQPIAWHPQLDGKENVVLADALRQGNFGDEPFYRAMLYPGILALLQMVVGSGTLPIAASLLGLAAHFVASGCVQRLSHRIWRSNAAGNISLALYGLNPVLVYFALEPLDITLGIALCLVGLLIAGLGNPEAEQDMLIGPKRCLLGGLFLGLAVLARPHFLPVLILLPVALSLPLLGRRIAWRRSSLVWVAGGICLLGMGLVNFTIGGEFRMLPWQGAYNLYAANRTSANGKYLTQEVFLRDIPEGANPTRLEGEFLYARATGESPPFSIEAQNSFWREEFWNLVKEDPLRFAALQGRKIYYLFNNFEQYNNKTYSYQKARSPVLRWNPLGWGLLFVLGAGAFFLRRPLQRPIPGLLLLATGYAAAMGLYFVSARFRLPLVSVLGILAGGWGLWLAPYLEGKLDKVRDWGRQPLIAFGAMILAGVLTFTSFFEASDTRTFIQDEMLLANAAAESGVDAEAFAFAARVLERDPYRQDALRIYLVSAFNLSVVGHPVESTFGSWEALRPRVEQFQPGDPAAFLVSGVILWNAGHSERARALWLEAVERYGVGARSSQICLALVDRDPERLVGLELGREEVQALQAILRRTVPPSE